MCMTAGSVFAQQGQVAQAQASVATEVVAPIDIQKNTDMNFGNIAVGAATGTVQLLPNGTRNASGSISLPANSGSPSAATFTVTGQGNYTFAITLPATAHTIKDASNNTMTVTNFTSDPATTGTLSNGSKVINVGATLNASANQPVGTYTSTTAFEVKVEYN